MITIKLAFKTDVFYSLNNYESDLIKIFTKFEILWIQVRYTQLPRFTELEIVGTFFAQHKQSFYTSF